MWKDFKKSSEERMGKSVDNIQSQMNTLRASGARYTYIDIYTYLCKYICIYKLYV
jgi:ribosome recycling factor